MTTQGTTIKLLPGRFAHRVFEHVADGRGVKRDMTILRFLDDAPNDDEPGKGEPVLVLTSDIVRA